MCMDTEHFAQITGYDPEFALELLDAFLEDSHERIAQMEQGIHQQDINIVRRGAHQLKGSSANVGAFHIHTIAKAMELENHSWAELATMLDQLKAGLAEVTLFRQRFLLS
ncbi:MAG: Hpt domain-containing protein [Pseudanabaenaceae cyanobacterium]